MHVEDDDTIFDSNSGRVFARQVQMVTVFSKNLGRMGRSACTVLRDGVGWEDNGALTARVLDVLDADRDVSTNDLLHGEGMDDFRAIIGQF